MSRIVLVNVRLAFPRLWRAEKVGTDPKSKPKFGASLILEGDHPQLAEVRKAMDAVAAAKWGKDAPGIMKGLKAQDKLCLHDGDTKSQYQGFEGNYFISANADKRPNVFDRNRSPLAEDDGKPYSGCYVNAIVELWAQQHPTHGKRINATLCGVQFFRDGDAFSGGAAPASEDEFADLSAEDGGSDDPTA